VSHDLTAWQKVRELKHQMRVQMSVIKVEIRLREIPAAIEVFKNNRKKALDLFSEEIRRSVSNGFNQLLNTETDVPLKNGHEPLSSGSC
jgi:hypothetical protein